MNGTIFDERPAGLIALRNTVLCYDIASGRVTFPKKFERLWN